MRRACALLVAILLTAPAIAAPVITAVSGTTTQGSILTVSGTGLPTKANSKLYSFSTAQEGLLAPHSTLSFTTSFDETQNVAVVTDANRRWGSRSFRSNWNYTLTQRAATFRIDINPTYNDRWYASWWEKSDIDYTPRAGDLSENWKFNLRAWHQASSSVDSIKYPDIIFGHLSINQSASNIRMGNEFPTNSTTIGAVYGFPTTTWRRMTILIKEPSGLGVADGAWYVYRESTLISSKTNQQMNDAGHQGLPGQVYIQHVIANANVPAGTNWWTSDQIIDLGWGRYEVCNNATYASATHCELQPFTSVSATGATLNLHLGSFSSAAGLSLIAIDNNNVASPGVSLGGALPDPPPVIVNLSPGTSPAAGGATITMTATGLTATPSVTVNGAAATGENWISATQMTFITPAGTAGTDADVLVENPDGQTDTLTAGIHYDPAPLIGNLVLPWALPF